MLWCGFDFVHGTYCSGLGCLKKFHLVAIVHLVGVPAAACKAHIPPKGALAHGVGFKHMVAKYPAPVPVLPARLVMLLNNGPYLQCFCKGVRAYRFAAHSIAPCIPLL